MAELIIREGKKSLLGIPHHIFVNERYVGMLGVTGKAALKPCLKALEARIQLSPATYTVRIQSLFPFFSSTVDVRVDEASPAVVTFADKEFWWDLLFWGDMLAWILKLVLHIGHPWGLVYELVSDLVFIIWIIHEYRTRKNYFAVTVENQTQS